MLALSVLAAVAAAEPNTCQPRSAHPFMPIFHIVGNITTDAADTVINVEAINDVSSVVLYKGIYHVFHQCCQNHWDHVISKDLIHWTRLPPPIVPNMNPTGVPSPLWYDAHGSWDGSLAIPRDNSSFPGGNGIEAPVILMTAVPGKPPPNTPPSQMGHITMAIVRATNASDPFLLSWTKDKVRVLVNGLMVCLCYCLWACRQTRSATPVGLTRRSRRPTTHRGRYGRTAATGTTWFII